eukprot:4139624-Pyramimonas_sp.AAC.1
MDSLIYWGMPADIAAAMVEEAMDLRATANLGGAETIRDLLFTRRIRQGGLESAFAWNIATRRKLDCCIHRWRAA